MRLIDADELVEALEQQYDYVGSILDKAIELANELAAEQDNPRERIVSALKAERDKYNTPFDPTRSAIIDAIAIVERELAGSGWQPIETAPMDGRKLLLAWHKTWPDNRWHYEVAPAGNVDIARRGCGSVHGDATHWMPLTEPPTTSDAKGEG